MKGKARGGGGGKFSVTFVGQNWRIFVGKIGNSGTHSNKLGVYQLKGEAVQIKINVRGSHLAEGRDQYESCRVEAFRLKDVPEGHLKARNGSVGGANINRDEF